MIVKSVHSCQHSGRELIPFRRANGFTTLELVVIVAILTIIARISIVETRIAYDRDRINQASLLLAGWLQEISSKPDVLGQSCAVTITTGTVASGAQVASVSPTSCSSLPVLRLPGDFRSASYSVGATKTTWSFTERNAIDSTGDVTVKFSLTGLTSLRCVRLNAISGLVRLGSNNATSDVSQTCSTWNDI